MEPRGRRQGQVRRERRRDALDRIVEEVEITAEAKRLRRKMDRGTAHDGKYLALELGYLRNASGRNVEPMRHASRSPCFMSCSATHGASDRPMTRSRRYDQKHRA